MVWRASDPQGRESAKIAPFIVPYTRGRGLDIGCGPWKPFPHFIGVDSGKAFGPEGADIQSEADDLSMFVDGSMDFVFSSHLLEHMEDTEKTLREWWRVIRPGGYLVLYLPHKEFYPNIGEEGANPDHKHDFMPEDIVEVMRRVCSDDPDKTVIVENEERNGGQEYSFFQTYRKGSLHTKEAGPFAGTLIYEPWRKPTERSCLVIRYGGVGDFIQASSAIARLKAEGFHVTLNTNVLGEEVMRHDPNVDAFVVQDKDQVPNHMLKEYWTRIAERYDRVYNLCESIEGRLLAVPGRYNHDWPPEVRRAVMGAENYVENQHRHCGVTFNQHELDPRFHATEREKMWARKQREKIGKNGRHPIIMWAMSGSAVHKVWPYMDNVIATLLLHTKARVVLSGGPGYDQWLEVGWENEPRVLKRTGKWSVRESLTFACHAADIVIGPETGVPNAVSMEERVAKIIYLSHSSDWNLTRDWVNTTVLIPGPEVDCYPCHRMHYGFDHCRRDEHTGVAACAANIGPERVWEAICAILERRAAA